MAAIAIPIIAAAAPLLMPLLEGLIQHVEGLFGKGTGATKFTTVLDAGVSIANKLSAAGEINGIVDPTQIAVMIQTIVQNLKDKGLLNGTAPATPAISTPSTTSVVPWTFGPFTLTITGH